MKALMKALISAGINPWTKKRNAFGIPCWLSQAQDAAAQPAPGASKTQRLAAGHSMNAAHSSHPLDL